jgi:hypothetical protein
MKDEKVIVIDINLTRGLLALLALALLMAAFLGYLVWGRGEVAASGPQAPLDHPFDLAQGKPLAQSSGMRGYYLTQSRYPGADADGTDGNGAGVCAEGYHFASLWEIMDPSNLKYNTDLGFVREDSGQGPPTGGNVSSWVRTGYFGSTEASAGAGNCNVWTTGSSDYYGTTARLSDNWTAGQDIHVWEVFSPACNARKQVWCVED